MRKLYLILAVIGFIAPNVAVAIESVDTGNVLLWLNPAATIQGMFGNRISTAFVVDLLFVVAVALIWFYVESRKLGMKNYWVYVALTFLFGLAGTFPLFLSNRESAAE